MSQGPDVAPARPDQTTDDAFLGGALTVRQPARGYRAGSDAVLLAASVDAESAAGATCLDVGAGVGTVGLCLARRIDDVRVVLMEPEATHLALARFNIEANGLGARVSAIAARVGDRADAMDAAGLRPESFDIVVTNPPYFASAAGTLSADPLRRASHALQSDITFADWARFLVRMVRPAGQLYLIHRASALAEVLATLDRRFGGFRVLPLHPRRGAPANHVIVMGRKGSRATLELLPGLVLHGDGHGYDPAIDAVLRHGAPLCIEGLNDPR
ncbi:MAG: methyltransferase [Hyphomicrobiaceae bacterium]|nr:methyltransferase [Hyphomicrobiaceae bacterium]